MSHDEHHASHGALYFIVFIALCGFTLASVVADIMHLPNKTVTATIVLAIATAKALCVMLFFMHLKFERAWKYMLLAPTLILAAGLMVALVPDIGRHYYTVEAPQIYEHEAEQAHADGHQAEAHH